MAEGFRDPGPTVGSRFPIKGERTVLTSLSPLSLGFFSSLPGVSPAREGIVDNTARREGGQGPALSDAPADGGSHSGSQKTLL